MEQVTEKQGRVLLYVADFAAEHGFAPTVRETARRFGVSIGAVQKHLKALVKKGCLKHSPLLSRGMVPASMRPVSFIPLLGRVCAGVPVSAEENIEDYVCVDMIPAGSASYFALRVKGDSMTGAGIFDNDIVIVKKQASADNGDIVVALVDDEATVKRLKAGNDGVSLEAANPAYAPITRGAITVLGKVVRLVRDLTRGRMENFHGKRSDK